MYCRDKEYIDKIKKDKKALHSQGSCVKQLWITGSSVYQCRGCQRALIDYGLFCVSTPAKYMGVLA